MEGKSLLDGVKQKIGNLVFVTPEMKSFKSKVGGLGDVGEELGVALAGLGVSLTFITLLYRRTRREVPRDGQSQEFAGLDYSDVRIEDTGKDIEVEVAGEKIKARIKRSKIGKADVIFLENERYADIVYYGDLLRQAIFIGRGTLEALKALDIKPTIIHYHDALASLVSFVRTDKRYSEDPFFRGVRLAFTIHNAGRAYQEIFDNGRFHELGIDRIHWNGMVWQGAINLTHAGLFYSQACNTVSEDYARTLMVDGEGMSEMFKNNNVFGIVNGIDFDYWKLKRGKREARLDMLRQVRERSGAVLDEDRFTVVLPRRITFQKGFDIVIEMVKDIVRERSEGGIGAQFIVLGRAHESDGLGRHWEEQMRKLSHEYKDRFVFINDFDQPFAKLMYEGGDLLLYPSKPDREPCGTGYILAMANMTPSLGTNTGGLVEVIKEFCPLIGRGSGYKVCKEEYSSKAFLEKMDIISDLFHNHKDQWKILVDNAFKRAMEFDIRKCAEEYVLRMYMPLVF